jgi:hypothetical protein
MKVIVAGAGVEAVPASNWRLPMRTLMVRGGNRPGMSWVLKPVVV